MVDVLVQTPSESGDYNTIDTRQRERHVSSLPQRIAALDTAASSFVGRTEEVTSLRKLLEETDVRLVSLTGPGGVGKTRLALRVVAELEADIERARLRPDAGRGASQKSATTEEIHVVNLAEVSDDMFVAHHIAQSIGVREFQSLSTLDGLKYHLAYTNQMLVLDNFEHVMGAATLVSDLLKAVPNLKLFITSREPLRIYGEREVAVLPLSVPTLSEAYCQEDCTEQLAEHSAVRLFIDRACAVKKKFAPTPSQLCDIAEICRRLDGLPLAIELAAARIRIFSTVTILSQMSDMLALLTGGAKDTPERHRTMRAAIAWSVKLLTNEERQLLCRLAIFAGGCTEEAVRTICSQISDRSLTPPTVQLDIAECKLHETHISDLLASLVEKNLLSIEDQSGARPGNERYVMLETIRQYALEQLKKSGSESEVRARHAAAYLKSATFEMQDILGPRQVQALMHLDRERSNIRSALQYYAETGSLFEQITLASSMVWVWNLHGHFEEGEVWLNNAIVVAHEAQLRAEREGNVAPPELLRARARILFGAGVLARERSDHVTARATLRESDRLFSQIGIKAALSYVKSFLALVAKDEGCITEATRLLNESLAISIEVGDKWGQGLSLSHMGLIATEDGNYAHAGDLYKQSLAAFREVGVQAGVRPNNYQGERWGMGQAFMGLGNIAYYQRRFVQARAYFEQSLKLFTELGATVMLSWIYTSLGHSALMLGRYEEAVELYRKGLPTHREMSNLRSIAYTLNGLGETARARHDYREAENYYNRSYPIFMEINDKSGCAWSLHNQGVIALRRGNAREADALFRESLDIFIEIAHPRGVPAAISGLASVAALQHETQKAAALFGAAQTLLATTGAILEPVDEEEYIVMAERARLQGGEETWQSGWNEGCAIALGEEGLEKVLAYAVKPLLPAQFNLPKSEKKKNLLQKQDDLMGSAHYLSKREMEVLRLLSQGLTNKEIAEKLDISYLTINAHLRTIYGKLRVTTRIGATRAAADRGLF